MNRTVLFCRLGIVALAFLISPGPWRAAFAATSPLLPPDEYARIAPRIVNGVLTSARPTTGALLAGDSAENARLLCSGTLIGCDTFLTAGHCACAFSGFDCRGSDAPDPSQFFVFLQHAGLFAVSSVAVHPNFGFPSGDVAVMKLARAVDGISPSEINTVKSPPFGKRGLIVGFGVSSDFDSDAGLKRDGHLVTASCEPFLSDEDSVCWNFDPPVGDPGSDSSTCYGDSGGPLFVRFGGANFIAGVTSGGIGGCLPPTTSFDANVFTYRDFIEAEGGSDLDNSTCGCLPPVGNQHTVVLGAFGDLGFSESDALPFSVPPGTRRLRVAMNAFDDFFADFDLRVKAGTPPLPGAADCEETGTGQFAACEFTNPPSGNWFASVSAANGSGTYQVTVTFFGDDASSDGRVCSDANACTANDRCSDSICSGTPLTGTSCADEDACTLNEICQAGVCVTQPLECTDVSGPCEEPVICVPSEGCVKPPKPDFTPCDSGNEAACSSPGFCFAGECSGESDSDDDKVCDFDDNCRFDANTDQKNLDGDSLGDVCDSFDAQLRITKASLTRPNRSKPMSGHARCNGEFLVASPPDSVATDEGIAVTMKDGLNLSTSIVWSAGECKESPSGRITCRKSGKPSARLVLRPLPSTTPGLRLYTATFRADNLDIGTPFVPPVRMRITTSPGTPVTGVDRGGSTRNCVSGVSGLTCGPGGEEGRHPGLSSRCRWGRYWIEYASTSPSVIGKVLGTWPTSTS